jgi:hypothetical protein
MGALSKVMKVEDHQKSHLKENLFLLLECFQLKLPEELICLCLRDGVTMASSVIHHNAVDCTNHHVLVWRGCSSRVLGLESWLLKCLKEKIRANETYCFPQTFKIGIGGGGITGGGGNGATREAGAGFNTLCRMPEEEEEDKEDDVAAELTVRQKRPSLFFCAICIMCCTSYVLRMVIGSLTSSLYSTVTSVL